jgi:hypothetical protein
VCSNGLERNRDRLAGTVPDGKRFGRVRLDGKRPAPNNSREHALEKLIRGEPDTQETDTLLKILS